MKRSDVIALFVVPAAVGLVLLSPTEGAEPGEQGSTQAVPIESATVGCPVLPRAAAEASAAVASPDVDGQLDEGLREQAVDIAADGNELGAIEARGDTWTSTRKPVLDGLRASAHGALAAGLTGAVSAVFDGDDRRGLVASGCAEPAARWWFVGTSSGSDRTGELQLTNPEPTVAVVNLRFLGPDGPLDVDGAEGISVAPGETRRLQLDDLVPGEDDVTVSVTATQGRVAGGLFETSTDALSPAGVDMIPAAADPAREVAITGLPEGPGQHVLTIANPRNASAVVDVEVLSGRGAFAPEDLDGLRVPPGGTLTRRLTGPVDEKTAGVSLSSSQPVTASVQTSTDGQLTDRAYTSAGVRLAGGAVTPLLPDLDGTLVLSNAARSALTADIAWMGPRGRELDTATIDLRGGQTRAREMDRPGQAVYVRIDSDRPEGLVAAMQWTHGDEAGDMLSTVPLRQLRLTVDRLRVQWDPVQP